MSCTPRKEITNIYQLFENYGDDWIRNLRSLLYAIAILLLGGFGALYFFNTPQQNIVIEPTKCICEVTSFTPMFLPQTGSSN